MLLLVLREEIICVILLSFLIFYYSFNKVKDKEMMFLRLAFSALLHLGFDIATVITVNRLDDVAVLLNRWMHRGFYLTGLLFAAVFFQYVIHLAGYYQYARLLHHISYIPLVIFAVLLLFLPMEYVMGHSTNYSYGLLAFVGYGLFLLYCTASVGLLVAARHRLERRIKWALFPLLLVMYVAILLQAVIPELLMTGANATLICLGFFVTLDNPDKDFMEQALWDFLTGLKNRNCYNRDLVRYTHTQGGWHTPRRIGFVVADLNYLKTVNDEHGHAEGDRLIAAAAAVLQEHLCSARDIYRLGGDEFVAIYLLPDDQVVAAELERVSEACASATGFAVPLSIAMGYAAGTLTEDVKPIFDAADAQMYVNKKRVKGQSKRD